MDSAKRVMSGTFGQVWLDGEVVAECYKFQAKISFTRENVPMAGKLVDGKKLVKAEQTGSMTLHAVRSIMASKVVAAIKAGKDPRFTLISKIDDPDAYGAERISFIDVALDDLTLADWEVGVKGQREVPFSYGDFEFLDMIEV